MTVPARGPQAWYFCERFYPDDTSTAHYSWHIARSLAEAWPLTAITTLMDDTDLGDDAGMTVDGVRIVRIARASHLAPNLPGRAWRGVKFAAAAAWYAWRHVRRGDVVLLVTNPPILPIFLLPAANARRATGILLVHDVYPDALVAARLVRRGGIVERLLGWVLRRPLAWSDAVVACGRDMMELLSQRVRPQDQSKVCFIPNWADDREIAPGSKAGNPFLLEASLSERFVVQFVGNIGRMQPIELLVEASDRLRDRCPEALLLFFGSGARLDWLKRESAQRGRDNVRWAGSFPRSQQSEFLAACDVAYVGLIPGMAGVGVPSRLYNVLAAGRPVIAQVAAESEVGRVVREERVGWVVPPGDVDALVTAIVDAYGKPSELRAMAIRARRAAEGRFSRDVTLAKYQALVGEFIRPAVTPASRH